MTTPKTRKIKWLDFGETTWQKARKSKKFFEAYVKEFARLAVLHYKRKHHKK